MEQFLDTTSISGGFFSADESRILFSSNKTGIWNAYTIPVGGGEWTPVTKSTKDSTYAVSFFPTDNRMLITRDQGGNELNHLYVLAEDGAERDLTPGEKLKAGFRRLDARRLGVLRHVQRARSEVLRHLPLRREDLQRTLFFENKDGYFPAGVSDDAQWVSLAKVNTTNDSDIYLWNAAMKRRRKHISPHTGRRTSRRRRSTRRRSISTS